MHDSPARARKCGDGHTCWRIFIFAIILIVIPFWLIGTLRNSTSYTLIVKQSHANYSKISRNRSTVFECLQRFNVENARKYDHQWHIDQSLPIPISVISNENRTGIYIVFDMKRHSTERRDAGYYIGWLQTKWTCWPSNSDSTISFNFWNNQQFAWPESPDAHGHTLVIFCPISTPLNEEEFRISLRAGNVIFSDLLVCFDVDYSKAYPPQGLELAACTSVRGDKDRARIPEWIEYHRLIGFEHFIFYINDAMDIVESERKRLRDFSVSIIPLDYDQDLFGAFFFQQAAQVDCVYRMRGRSRWVALHDVDEFFQLLGNYSNSTLLHLLSEHRFQGHKSLGGVGIAAFRFGQSNFSNPNNRSEVINGTYISQYRWRTNKADEMRKKVIVRPENVEYVSVHDVTFGGIVKMLNWNKEVRMNHYKDKIGQDFPGKRIYDESLAISDLLKKVETEQLLFRQ